MDKSFLKSGHTPTLIAAFLYFDLSFMVWVILGPLGVQIAKDLALTPAQKGLMVATPVLAGALLRIVMGVLVDHLKPKMAGIIGQIIVMLRAARGVVLRHPQLSQVLALGLALGVAGAAFAVALPLASRWYPPEHQGTALGIAGAGNSGTVLAALFAPASPLRSAGTTCSGLAVIPAAHRIRRLSDLREGQPGVSAGQVSRRISRSSQGQATPGGSCSSTAVTFGGFVGLASSLTIYFNDHMA